ncbi:hypothetical protein D3C86_1563690 [compost metagenome]
MRARSDSAPVSTSTVSRKCNRLRPWYQLMFSDSFTTLSPFKALTGMKFTSFRFNSAANARYLSVMAVNTVSLYPTISILFRHTTTCSIPSKDTRYECLIVCSTTPFLASIKIMASLAVEAPVTMLRVYWMCPGVSAMMNLRLSVWKYL